MTARPPTLSPPEDSALAGGDAASKRFTLDGDATLEAHLSLTCARVLSGLRGLIPARKLELLLLGGGYGRGEGGVLQGPAGDRPYNDLEFYVAIRGNRHLNEFLYGQPLEVLGQILTHLADVEVEFKITSVAELSAKPISMFSYDLLAGHRLLWGDRRKLARCAHHHQANRLPIAEGSRLLMNRCSGLLMAQHKLRQTELTPDAADFIRRNIAKVQLACGDAVLVANGLYHWSCRERHIRLLELADSDATLPDHLVTTHAEGVAFKLHPAHASRLRPALERDFALARNLAEAVWLAVETRRVGRFYASAEAYARDTADLFPETSRVMNTFLNLRATGFRPAPANSLVLHPRNRVFRSLAGLLWQKPVTPEGSPPRLETGRIDTSLAEYLTLWRRVQ